MTVTARISKRLGSLAVPIDSVQPYPGNPHQGDVGAISTMLERFGQMKPIVVQGTTGYIAAGNSTWKAAKALNWDSIAANIDDDLTDEQAKAYLVADNRASALGYDELTSLLSFLQEIEAGTGLEGTGYDGDDLDELMRTLEADHDPQGGGRGRQKPSGCVMPGCEEIGLRFQLKFQWVDDDGTEFNRGAGSVVFCEADWLRIGAPHMARPVDGFDELKRPPEEAEDEVVEEGAR